MSIYAPEIARRLIEPLLKVCQKLQTLELNHCSDNVFASIVEECPNLKIIAYNHKDGIDAKKILYKNMVEKSGFRELYTVMTHLYIDNALTFLDKHKQTLEILDIDSRRKHNEQQSAIATAINSLRVHDDWYFTRPRKRWRILLSYIRSLTITL